MGYKQKSGPLQRAGYDKNTTTPFKLEETNLAAGQRDEFGTLIPEGDFSEGVTVTAKMPERTKRAIETFVKNIKTHSPGGGNIGGDRDWETKYQIHLFVQQLD